MHEITLPVVIVTLVTFQWSQNALEYSVMIYGASG